MLSFKKRIDGIFIPVGNMYRSDAHLAHPKCPLGLTVFLNQNKSICVKFVSDPINLLPLE